MSAADILEGTAAVLAFLGIANAVGTWIVDSLRRGVASNRHARKECRRALDRLAAELGVQGQADSPVGRAGEVIAVRQAARTACEDCRGKLERRAGQAVLDEHLEEATRTIRSVRLRRWIRPRR